MSTESEYLNHNGHLSFQGPPWKLHGRTHLSHTNSVILPSPEKRANKNAYPWTYLTKRDQLSDANLLPFFQIIKHQYNKKKGNFLIYKKKKKIGDKAWGLFIIKQSIYLVQLLYGAFSLFDFGLPEYVFRGREKSESVPTRIESDMVHRMKQTTPSTQVIILFLSVSKLSLLCFWGNTFFETEIQRGYVKKIN